MGHLMPRATPKRHSIDRRADRVLADMATLPDDWLLTTPEVAAWFCVSVCWLEIGRHEGWGPPFRRLGKRIVRYTAGDCREYLKQRTYARIADYQQRAVVRAGAAE
jgi:hypothetical protein